MNATQYATSQLEQVFGLMNMCADGMDDKQYNFNPDGTCNAAAKSHVHAMTSVDFFINQWVAGEPMLWPEFAAKLGLSPNPMEIWGHTGEISLAAMKDYSARVQKAALECVGSLSESDLDREIETQFFGKKTAAWILQLIAMHTSGHAGDIASVKGMQGLKGLPF